MQNVPCAVYMKNLQGRYVYVNETCAKVFHRTFEDWIGKTDEELLLLATNPEQLGPEANAVLNDELARRQIGSEQ